MSEPEIARRCLSCGASVRGRASFCPQCGNRMAGAATEGENHPPPAATMTGASDEPRPSARSSSSSSSSSSTLVEEAARVAATLNDKLPPLSEETPASGNHKSAPEREREPPETREEAATETTQGAQAEARGRIGRRAATVGASVGENLRPRVEKLREASTVVLDEAADDPGLRFVIIAVVLFLLFLFILVLSYILG